MLNFFRKIRQHLLAEGSLRKYFIYSIGEILLVVIGILIALNINNQNEERKESRKIANDTISFSVPPLGFILAFYNSEPVMGTYDALIGAGNTTRPNTHR